MREIFIKYNPYRLETEILIDGMTPKQNSRLNFTDCRLQEWIEDLPAILFEECRDRDYKLTFQGTILDYEDVEEMAHEAKKNGMTFLLEHIAAKEALDKEVAINEIFAAIQEGPFDELKDPAVINAFNMAKNDEFGVDVIATMSAGKSTLINALLRRKLMPAKQEACTATITEIKDNDGACFMAKAYDSSGNLIQYHPEISLEIMENLNNDQDVFKIRIEGDVPFVSSKEVALILRDTPGPNNSRDPEHKVATYRMLSESSKTVVLYILNATQRETVDDSTLLHYVADSMKVEGKKSRDRFIFVVNKLDDFDRKNDNVESTIAKTRTYLENHGIENANIYPLSALTALNIRTILTEENSDADEIEVAKAIINVKMFNKYSEMHFENLAPLTPSVRGTLNALLDEAKNQNDEYKEALIHCGIIPIEMAIQAYVEKYAKTAKIKNIVDTFEKRLESAKTFEATKREIAENLDKQQEILADIEKIKKELAHGEDAKRFMECVERINYDNEIKKMAQQSLLEVQKKITELLTQYGKKISKREAEETCRYFARFADNLQAELQVKLEQLVTNHVYKNANNLVEEYKRKLSELAHDISVGGVNIIPFELMQGEVSKDIDSLIKNLVEKERVKVDEVWIENSDKKWYKPWTWFQESGYWKGIYEDREYVDGEKLAQRFFAPIQERLYENSNSAVAYAKKQTETIKRHFSKMFCELDSLLKQKLQDLEDCAKDNKDVERRILESQDKLKWLEDIQEKTKSILDI